MTKLGNLKTVHKLIVIAGIFVMGQVVGTIFSTWGLSELSQRAEALYRVNLLPVKELGELKALNYKMVAQIGFHIQAYDSAAVTKAEKEIAAIDQEIDDLLAQYVSIIVSDSERKTFEQYTHNWGMFKEAREKVLKLSRLHSKDAATEVRIKELAPIREAMLDDLQSLIRENERQAQESYQGSQALTARLTTLQIAIVTLMSLLGLVVLWKIAAGITKNLSDVLGAAKKLAAGDLTARSGVTTAEETGALAQAFNQMAEALAHSVEEMNARIDILNTTSIVSEANLKGDITAVNEKYVAVSKYSREELMGSPHSITRHPDMPKAVFKEMWAMIGRGQTFRGVVKNRAKDGTPYYVDAVIKPIMGSNGKPRKYLGVRYDITEYELARHNMKGILEGINRSYAMIEFALDGTILTANENFLTAMHYTLDEIKGRHHRMFCDPAYCATVEYSAFWARLNRGEFETGVYRRIGKGGKEVWIQASYCPVKDEMGRPFKVVKLATDISGQKQAQNEVEKLIRAAAEGQLSERIRTDGLTGTSKELAESFNRLLDAVVAPMNDAMLTLTALSANDLTKRMTGNYQGEFEQMKVSLNGGLFQLAQTLVAVREAVESVSSGSEQITKGNEDLAQRTSEQASALEETSASMEEMTSTVKQNADNAKQANQLAIAARETADKGGAVTKKAVDAMGEINKSSKKIADIITVIDEIAFQTNLLALNAAVEAARAGEHGRGFAVVAAEVRNLAQRSATAAKEIKGLINESIQRVTDGSELVNQSGKTLEEIVHSVKQVTDIITEISAASQEQASGIDQVNRAIMSMDQTTQQNAALVEETTSASQSLKVQATELRRRVLRFKIEATEAEKAEMPAVHSLREFVAHTIRDAYDGTGERPTQAQQQVPTLQKGGKGTLRPAHVGGVPSATVAGKGEQHANAVEGFEAF